MRHLLILSVLLLAACGGGSKAVTCVEQYWNGEVGTCLPEGWFVMDRETLRQRGVPEEVLGAFQAESPESGQFPTVSITKEPLPTEEAPGDYSQASIRAVEALPGYEKIDAKSIDIAGEEVTLHVFSAKPKPEDPKRRFYQVSTVNRRTGYTISATAPYSVEKKLEQQMLFIMGSLIFEEPK